MTKVEIRFLVPLEIYDDDYDFAMWLFLRDIHEFFWEVVRYDGWVIIEVID